MRLRIAHGPWKLFVGLAPSLFCFGACLPGGEAPHAWVSLALRDGPVPFGTERDVSSGTVKGVSALDAGDLDGDGLSDIVVFEGGKHAGGRVTFAWFEQKSGGGWRRHELSRPGTMRPFIGASKLGDFDGDGDLDVVVTMDNHSGSPRSAYLYWLENPRPARSTTAAWSVHVVRSDLPLHHINDLEVADLDSDGRLDFVVRSLQPNQLHLFFATAQRPVRTGDWAQRTIDATPFGGSGEGFAVGDIDRQGHLDLTVCGHWLEAPPNPRSGTYQAHDIDPGYKRINGNVKEAIGDIDGDGRNDVVISPAEGYRGGSNHVLAWYRAPVDPRSATGWEQNGIETGFNGGHTVRLADMDRDRDLDLVVGVPWSNWGQTQSVRVYFNRGQGRFGSAQFVARGKGLYSGAVVDLEGDGDLDIVGQNTYSGSSRPFVFESQESTASSMDGGREDPDAADAGLGDAGFTDMGSLDAAWDASLGDASAGDPGAGDPGSPTLSERDAGHPADGGIAAPHRDAAATPSLGSTGVRGGSVRGGCAIGSAGGFSDKVPTLLLLVFAGFGRRAWKRRG